MGAGSCYHCDLPLPEGSNFEVEILGKVRQVCCPGCQAVASAILQGGYERFYDKRTTKSRNPEIDPEFSLDAYDNPEIESRYARRIDNHTQEVTLNVEGINCGACLWLIESSIRNRPGVKSVSVNYATRRALVDWDDNDISLRDVLGMFRGIGFSAVPYEPRQAATQLRKEHDQQLRRIGIAGVLGMQIMMIAVALYFGRSSGMQQNYEYFFEWISMLLAFPIVFYCARPLFTNAWRSLRHKQPSIDIPVSLAIGIAFTASVWATTTANGDTYFEAVGMFVFFLLSTRYFELVARERGLDAASHLMNSTPIVCRRLDREGGLSRLSADRLTVDERVVVGAGETVPVDGVIEDRATCVDESVISGESVPVVKLPGEQLIGGSVNLDSPIILRVTSTYDGSTVSHIARLAERAQSVKPRIVKLVDQVAMWFVFGLILVTLVVALYCWVYAPYRLVSTVIAVLVIACPCALSLATPAAVSASVGRLTRSGIVILKGDSLEKLHSVTQVVFDKTGTLTTGILDLEEVHTYKDWTESGVLAIAAALEVATPHHPVARSLSRTVSHQSELANSVGDIQGLEAVPGAGVSGVIAGTRYYFGSEQFIGASIGEQPDTVSGPGEAGRTTCLLANQADILGRLFFSDESRPGAVEAIDGIRRAGLTVSILSGDNPDVVARVAQALSIDDYDAQLSPQSKLEYLERLQSGGESAMVVGDGVNDAPVLAAATVGVAMGSGSDLARTSGDIVLINDRLSDLNLLLRQVRWTRRVIAQNLFWAVGYNLLALPLGIMGFVPPWIAVIGMSASSLVVILNALRLSGKRNGEERSVDGAEGKTWAYV